MDYENFCTQILDINSKIRFAVVYDSWSKRIAGGLRKGIKNLLSENEEKDLVNLATINWKAHKDMAKSLGKTIYTLAEYEKVKRFSFYLGEDYLLLLSTEKDADTNEVVEQVIKLYYKNQN